ncbi:MAG: tRNA (guanosine(46)-N7)-methyltransferase TrmB, partial [Firmicutes bacterium HGW-Firmicutes-10]
FICKELSVDYRRMDHPEDVITEYEQRFLELNQPIYRSVWRKKR